MIVLQPFWGLELWQVYAVAVVFVMILLGLAWQLWQRGWVNKLHEAVEQRTRRLEDVSRRFRLMADNAYDLIAVSDAQGNLDYCNAAFTRALGFSRDQLRQVQLLRWVHPHQRELLAEILQKVVKEGGTQEAPMKFPKAGGGWLEVELVAKGLPDSDWVVRNVVLHARDVSQRQKMLDELARNEQRFKDFAGSSADWLWETDATGAFTYVSPGVANVLGYLPEELLGARQIDLLFPSVEDPGRELLNSRVERLQPYRELEFWTKSKAGERLCLRLSGVPILAANQDLLGYRGAASNVTASKVEREHVFRLATTDHLTGLLNGARFQEELERAVVLAKRHKTSGVVLFIDLDRFKEVNDTHGHAAGDEILLGVSEILRDSVRSTDVVARRGGDEFSIIMHNISVEAATAKVQRMIEKIKDFGVEYNGTRLTVTMSVGMVQYPQDERGADHLIMSADLAMYRAKDMGRNRLFVDASDATSETAGSVRAQLEWVDRLRYCLEHEEFEMHYQPIVPANGKKRPLFEALLRIYDEQGKVASPALYIDAAEHFGLIQQLDLAVVKRVFETQQQLQKENVQVDISINLSSRTLGDPAVIPKLQKLLADTQINPHQIVLEITETMALHDPAQMRDIGEIRNFIDSLRQLGFRFALDDFGTGFTSFRYLKVLKVDLVKIDGEYIKDLAKDPDDRLFVRSMVQLCNGLGIETIGEFVEDQETMAWMMELGVEAGQGWLFGKPMADIRALAKEYTGKTMHDWGAGLPLIQAVSAKEAAAILVPDVPAAVPEVKQTAVLATPEKTASVSDKLASTTAVVKASERPLVAPPASQPTTGRPAVAQPNEALPKPPSKAKKPNAAPAHQSQGLKPAAAQPEQAVVPPLHKGRIARPSQSEGRKPRPSNRE